MTVTEVGSQSRSRAVSRSTLGARLSLIDRATSPARTGTSSSSKPITDKYSARVCRRKFPRPFTASVTADFRTPSFFASSTFEMPDTSMAPANSARARSRSLLPARSVSELSACERWSSVRAAMMLVLSLDCLCLANMVRRKPPFGGDRYALLATVCDSGGSPVRVGGSDLEEENSVLWSLYLPYIALKMTKLALRLQVTVDGVNLESRHNIFKSQSFGLRSCVVQI